MIRFLLTVITFISLDSLWIIFVAKKLYISMLGGILRMHDGHIQADMFAAFVVYFALILGIYVFVFPVCRGKLYKPMIYGALFGFVAYATYDFTSLAIISSWSLKVSIIDTAWGMVLCSITSFVACFPLRR